MCLIIDTSKIALFLADPWGAPHRPIARWLSAGNGSVAIGGPLRVELERVGEARRQIREWIRAGRAAVVSDEAVSAEATVVAATGRCRSNDVHVIALARVSGARVLYTGDRLLATDFKDRRILTGPAGQVFRTETDSRHLRHTRACRRFRK